MDPFSVTTFAVGGAKALWAVVKIFEDFREQFKEVDSEIDELASLSLGLTTVLEQLEQALASPLLSATENASFWSNVHKATDSCKATIDELEQKLKPLRTVAKNNAQQAWKTLRLNWSKKSIDHLIDRMKTHSVNLQLSLQIANAIIAAAIPPEINARQQAGFERLERMIETLALYIDQQGSLLRRAIANSNSFEPGVDPITTQLYLTAKSIASGSVGRSIRGSSSGSTSKTVPRSQVVFDDFRGPHSSQASPAMSQSRLGDSERRNIYDWVVQAKMDQDTPPIILPEKDSDEDSDLDLVFDVARESSAQGMEFFEQQNFGAAREFLKLAIDKAKRLSSEQKERLGLQSIWFHYGQSCVIQSALREAAPSFKLVIEDKASGENTNRLQCFALYQLAKVHLKLHDLKAADKYCKRALSRIRNEESMGAESDDYYDALYLRVLILWANDLKTQAQANNRLLPLQRRIQPHAFNESLEAVIGGPAPVSSAGSDEHEHRISRSESSAQGGQRGSETPYTLDSHISDPATRTSRDYSLKESTAPTNRNSKVLSIGPTSVASLSKLEERARHLVDPSKLIFRRQAAINKLLRATAREGDLKALEILLSVYLAHLDVDMPSSGIFAAEKDTLLMIAASKGHIPFCERLLSIKDSVNIIRRGKTALDHAIISNNFPTAKFMIRKAGARVDCIPGQEISSLARAVQLHQWKFAELILDSGADIDDPNFPITTSRRSALMQAAFTNNVVALEWLLERKVSVNGPAPNITTPLIEAARASAYEALRVLLLHNAVRGTETERGETALKVAQTWWFRDFIRDWPKSQDQKPPKYEGNDE